MRIRMGLLLLLWLCATALWANQAVHVTCAYTGPVLVSGLPSSNKVGIVYPGCRIAVYFTGTTNLATIYSDNNNTVLGNPFTANTLGLGLFYAPLGRYDVLLSGGGMPAPMTISDVLLQDVTTINGTFAISGSGSPVGVVPCTSGNAGQTYTNTANGYIYSCTGTAWIVTTGPTGPIGPAGPPNSLAAGTTTSLPPGSSATVSITGIPPSQFLNLGIPAGTPGGSLSYPGVVTDNNNGLNVQNNVNAATVSANSVTAGSLPGYRQNMYGAASRNRDGILLITVTPQDMPGCATSGQGLIDDAPCFNAAIAYLNTLDNNVQRRLMIPYSQYGYWFRNPGYLQQLPHDFGDYHGYAGYVTQASVSLYVQNGAIVSCSTYGGSGYAPSANLPVWIYDTSLLGSGGYATVQTDPTGLPTGCTVVQAGMNYPNTGVLTSVEPLGGDGAAATAALSGGTFSTGQNPITPSAGGSGYATLNTRTVPVNAAGLTCTTYPTFTATVTGSAVTAVNVATAGAACTYGGLGTATVPLEFGASCAGAQCTLLTPEATINLPCAVALTANLTVEGVGNPVIGATWNGSTANTSQMIAFCEPSGLESTNIVLKNFSISSAFIGFYFPYEVNHIDMDRVTFLQSVAFPFHAFGISGGFAGGNNQSNTTVTGFTSGSAPPFLQSTFTNISVWGWSGFTCGGEWVSRTLESYLAYTANPVAAAGYQNLMGAGFNQAPYANNNLQIWGHGNNNFESEAPCGNIKVDNFSFRPQSSTGAGSAIANSLDAFWETYIWKTQNGPASFPSTINNMSNGLASTGSGGLGCKFTQTVVDRTTDYQFGYPALTLSYPGGVTNYPYYQCFPGITFSPFVFMPRYSGATQVSFPLVSILNVFAITWKNRPVINGRFDSLHAMRINTTVNNVFTDPYQQTGEVRAGINNTTRFQPLGERIEDLVIVPPSFAPNPAVQILVNGVAGSQRLYLRNVQGAPDQQPVTISGGPQTLSGCSLTVPVGGSGAGFFKSGTSGTCTVTITPGTTAPNGYRCSATDMSTVTDILSQTSTTTSTCVISGTTVSGDSITWQAVAY